MDIEQTRELIWGRWLGSWKRKDVLVVFWIILLLQFHFKQTKSEEWKNMINKLVSAKCQFEVLDNKKDIFLWQRSILWFMTGDQVGKGFWRMWWEFLTSALIHCRTRSPAVLAWHIWNEKALVIFPKNDLAIVEYWKNYIVCAFIRGMITGKKLLVLSEKKKILQIKIVLSWNNYSPSIFVNLNIL